MLWTPQDEDRFPRAGELATEIADVADNARHEGVKIRKRILSLRRSRLFNDPEKETPPDALVFFSRAMLFVGFRMLHAAHHAAGRAVGFSNAQVAELGGIRDQLGSFILTQEAATGKDVSADPPIPMPWEPYRPKIDRAS